MVLIDDADHSGPATRPLGALALGVAAVAAVLAPSYLLSLLTFPVAAVALALAVAARSDAGSRRLGTAAMVVALLSVVVATAVLVWP